MKNHVKRALSILLVAVMLIALAACGKKADAGKETEPTDDGKIGFTVIAVDLEGKETTFEVRTDAETVGEALEAEGILKGHDAEYGLYIDAVNGVELDWERDGKYWAFYVNGEYGMTGVDMTDIEPDTAYAFVKTKD